MNNIISKNKFLKSIYTVFKYVFENGPNFVFWFAILFGGYIWFSQLPSYIRIFIVIISITAIAILTRKNYKNIKSKLTSALIETATSEVYEVRSKEERVPKFQQSIPTLIQMKGVYRYAEEFARNWASDAKLNSLNYYLEYKDGKVSHTVQIYISSENRNEKLTTYFPSKSKGIEEMNGPVPSYEVKSSRIYSIKGWRKKIEQVIESRSSDIEKAEYIDIQISVTKDLFDGSEYLQLYMTFSIGDRQWTKRDEIHNN